MSHTFSKGFGFDSSSKFETNFGGTLKMEKFEFRSSPPIFSTSTTTTLAVKIEESVKDISPSPSPSDNISPISTSLLPAEAELQCNCNRPKMRVFCRRCGYILEHGRARKVCRVHPKVNHLMDLDICPKCRASAKCLIEVAVNDFATEK